MVAEAGARSTRVAKIGGLYVIIDPAACLGRDPVAVGLAALAGGATMLQWRDKQRDKGEQLAQARALYLLCQEHDAVFVVNDHADLALVLASGGVPPSALQISPDSFTESIRSLPAIS